MAAEAIQATVFKYEKPEPGTAQVVDASCPLTDFRKAPQSSWEIPRKNVLKSRVS